MDYLADETLSEIFLRLPVKPLIRLKCIKKRWNSLISSPWFVKEQLKKSLETCHQSLLLTTTPLQSVDLESWASLMVECGGATNLGYLMRIPDKPTKILGSCNGLVCMVFDQRNWTLLNPATREYIELPKPNHNSRSITDNFFGFGYDSSTDDYKLLRGSCTPHKFYIKPKEIPAMLDIFSFKSGSWTEIEGKEHRNIVGNDRVGTYHNGRLYWLLNKPGNRFFRREFEHDYEGVLSFDLATEKFCGVVKLPEFEHYGDDFYIEGLNSLAGRLLLYGGMGRKQIAGWIMNEDELESEPWTKIYDYSWDGEELRGFSHKAKVSWITKEGKIVANLCCRQWSQLQCYDPEKDEYKKEDLVIDQHYVDDSVYVESLVSPYSIFRQNQARMELRPRGKKILRGTI